MTRKLFLIALFIGAGIFLLPSLTNVRLPRFGSSKTCKDGSDVSCFGSVTLNGKNLRSLKCAGSAHLTDVIISNEASTSGSFSATGGSFGEISAAGSTSLTKTSVAGKTSCSGSFNATETSLNELSVSGASTLVNTKVTKPSSFSGALTATRTTFNDICTSRTSKATLTDCKVGAIKVRDNRWSSEPTKNIDLYGGVVEGNITFESKDGKVILHNNACVKGKVIGGQVIKK